MQDESCRTNGFSYRERPLKVALQKFFVDEIKMAVVS